MTKDEEESGDHDGGMLEEKKRIAYRSDERRRTKELTAEVAKEEEEGEGATATSAATKDDNTKCDGMLEEKKRIAYRSDERLASREANASKDGAAAVATTTLDASEGSGMLEEKKRLAYRSIERRANKQAAASQDVVAPTLLISATSASMEKPVQAVQPEEVGVGAFHYTDKSQQSLVSNPPPGSHDEEDPTANPTNEPTEVDNNNQDCAFLAEATLVQGDDTNDAPNPLPLVVAEKASDERPQERALRRQIYVGFGVVALILIAVVALVIGFVVSSNSNDDSSTTTGVNSGVVQPDASGRLSS
mgnify:CR=1 FL=1